jgi:pyruvate carboxylase
MTSNNLTAEDLFARGKSLSFPESVKSFFKGDLGQPHGGFPPELQGIILKGEKPITGRPNEHLQPADFDKEFADFKAKFGEGVSFPTTCLTRCTRRCSRSSRRTASSSATSA